MFTKFALAGSLLGLVLAQEPLVSDSDTAITCPLEVPVVIQLSRNRLNRELITLLSMQPFLNHPDYQYTAILCRVSDSTFLSIHNC